MAVKGRVYDVRDGWLGHGRKVVEGWREGGKEGRREGGKEGMRDEEEDMREGKRIRRMERRKGGIK